MKSPTCFNCQFWDQQEVIRRAGEATYSKGTCRRHAPRPVTTEGGDGSDSYPTWPTTMDWEWCGEHPRMQAWNDYIEAGCGDEDDETPAAEAEPAPSPA